LLVTRRSHPIVALSGALVLCASLASTSGCAAPRRTLPPGAIELQVIGVTQSDPFTCGLATVEALAAYHGLALSEAARSEVAARTAVQEGLSGGELREVLEAAGFEAYVFRGTLDDAPTGLLRQLARGRPPIVAIASAENRHHYVLLVGYDPPTRDVALLDPAQGRIVLPARRFREVWERAGCFTLLALPSSNSPVPPPLASTLSPERVP
jgi:ABC-type bacteriocin/lantibiotic exporter with double-glycine peptidase domain